LTSQSDKAFNVIKWRPEPTIKNGTNSKFKRVEKTKKQTNEKNNYFIDLNPDVQF